MATTNGDILTFAPMQAGAGWVSTRTKTAYIFSCRATKKLPGWLKKHWTELHGMAGRLVD